MRTQYLPAILKEIRILVSPDAAAGLAGAELAAPCPSCGVALVHRGVTAGIGVWECVPERRVYLTESTFVALRGTFGGAVKATPRPAAAASPEASPPTPAATPKRRR